MKLVLVDGSSILSTCFYGSATPVYNAAKTREEKRKAASTLMQTSEGIYTNGVYTMIRILHKLINEQRPTHMAVAWDISRNSFRKKIYPQYKANRGEAPEELCQQYKTMQGFLKEAGIAQFGLENYEADDIVGTLSKMFSMFIPTYIYTKDCDALQLVDKLTNLWLITKKANNQEDLPNNTLELTPELVEQRFQLKPSQIVDFKALAGDQGDNIPGVPGIGDKSAIALLKEYGAIENIYEKLEDEEKFKEELKEKNIKRISIKKLIEGKESAFLSKKLATIECNIQELENVVIDNLKLKIDKDKANDYLEELEIKTVKF